MLDPVWSALIRKARSKTAQDARAVLHCTQEQRSTVSGDVAATESGAHGSAAQRWEGQTGCATLWQRKGGLLMEGNVFLSNSFCHSRPLFPRPLVRNPG
jgi:hypothetical protein